MTRPRILQFPTQASQPAATAAEASVGLTEPCLPDAPATTASDVDGSTPHAAARSRPGSAAQEGGRKAANARKKGYTLTWQYSVGGYGHRVTVYERRGRTDFWISYTDRATGKPVKKCLKHRDRERAIRQCRDLSDRLRIASDRVERVGPSGEVPFPELFRLYQKRKSQHKKGAQPAEDERRVKIWTAFFAQCSPPIERPSQLTTTDRDDFVRLRRHGDLRVPGVAMPDPTPEPVDLRERRADAVKPTTVRADVAFLVSVLHWAEDFRVDGRPLVDRCPIKLPHEDRGYKPHRPRLTRDDVEDLAGVGPVVDPQGLFGDFVTATDGLGWRMSGVSFIRADDVKLDAIDAFTPHGSIAKNRYVDKEQVGMHVPMSKTVHDAIQHALGVRGLKPGQHELIFVSPRDPSRPWSRWHVYDLLARAERAAGLAHIGGFHAFRRKWVTERKGHAIPDLMRAGGWSDPRSLQPYLQDDPATTLAVVTTPTHSLRRNDKPGQVDTGTADASGTTGADDASGTGGG